MTDERPTPADDRAEPKPGTPLPWKVSDDFTCALIGTATADVCVMEDWPLEYLDEQRQNAAYIVTACNEYPELRHTINRLEREVAWLRERLEWRPIESAPRDGTRILLADNADCEIGLWLRHRCVDDSLAGYVDQTWPKFWLPLPDAPDASDGR